jgi:UDP:flavonoid glycosyltransferase YjiC (YdhE family)
VKIDLLVVGSRGDVEPHVALAVALMDRGHDVRVITHARFQSVVAARDMRFAPIAIDPHDLLRATRAGRLDPVSVARSMRDYRNLMTAVTSGAIAASRAPADVIVHSSFGVVGYEVGRHDGTPTVGTALQPIIASTRYPTTVRNSARSLGPVGNLLSGIAAEWSLGDTYRRATRASRGDGGLPRRAPANVYRSARRAGEPVLCAWSSTILPRPRSWPVNVTVTGFWPLPPAVTWRPTPAVATFLDAGEPPLLVGFGTAPLRNAGHVAAAVLDAARERGLRTIFQSTLAPLGIEPSPDVLVIDDVPYSWLLPRTAAVVHHSSAGMAHETIRAGRTSVTLPVYTDHFLWARRLHVIGVGAPPLAAKQVNARSIGARIDTALAPERRSRAAEVAEQLQRENGLRAAAELIEAAAR